MKRLLLLLPLLGACKPSSYKMIDIPYCRVPAGQPYQPFAESAFYLYKADATHHGQGPVSGTRPTLGLGVSDTVAHKQIVFAVVACAPPAGHDPVSVVSSLPDNAASRLSETHVPTVCADQRTLFHGTLKAHDEPTAKARGLDGVIDFPRVPLTCPAGTLERTTLADGAP